MTKQVDSTRFVDVMELVFAILMAAGFLEGWRQFTQFFPSLLHERDFLRGSVALLFPLSFTLILIRFFFAPSKNLPPLIRFHENKFWVLAFDVPIMILHSAIFYLICSLFKRVVMDWTVNLLFLYFSTLMLINAIWIISIELRLKNTVSKYLVIWRWNNKIHFLIAVLAFLFFRSGWVGVPAPVQGLIMIAITISNSFWDFGLAGEAYFRNPEQVSS